MRLIKLVSELLKDLEKNPKHTELQVYVCMPLIGEMETNGPNLMLRIHTIRVSDDNFLVFEIDNFEAICKLAAKAHAMKDQKDAAIN